MKYLDLFAGIGGFALGAEWAGLSFEEHYFSEIDPYAIKVYAKRFPDAIGLGDITTVTGLPQGDWIIAGGFPCQDISVAGLGAGLDGARSGLWYHYARLIGELRPRYAIMENVGALTFRGLDRVLGSLAEIGYDAEWQDIRASDVGAPHRRERIWIVAYPRDDRQREPVQPLGEHRGRSETDARGNGKTWTLADPDSRGCEGERLTEPRAVEGASRREPDRRGEGRRGKGEALADPQREGLEGLRPDAGQPGISQPGDNRPSVPLPGGIGEAERRDAGLPAPPAPPAPRADHRGGAPEHERREWWETEPDVGRVAHGIPARVDRLKCLGNSIVPQIAEMIFREIKAQL